MGFEPLLPTLARLKRGGLRNKTLSPRAAGLSPLQTSDKDGIACKKL
jgi:hypothetical protein